MTKNLLADDNSDDDDEASDTELTHFGRSLSEVENFKDAVISDSDEDSDSGRISGQLYFLCNCKKAAIVFTFYSFYDFLWLNV